MINNLNVTGLNTYEDESEFLVISPSSGSVLPAGRPILFESSGSDRRAPVVWLFGDGGTDTGSAVYHIYDTPGNYVVTCSSEKIGQLVTITISIGVYSYPKVTIIKPESPVVRALGDVVFEAVVDHAETATWLFGDGSTLTGLRVTKRYGLDQISDTVVCSATNVIGEATDTMEITIIRPMYVWEDTSGNLHSWHDENKFIVLRDGVSGFSDSTADVVTEQNCANMGEYLKTRTWRRRDGYGFNLMILGENHEEIEANRKELIEMLSNYDGEGRLIINFDDGTSVFIRAEKSPGYPRIANGLPPKQFARQQTAEIRFISSDPFFYGEEQTINAVEGNVTVTNHGDVLSPCEFEISSQVCRNTTTGKQVSYNGIDSIVGVVVISSDKACRAELNGANTLYRFSLDSEFWMIRPGTNLITGAAYVKFRPRWSGR